MTQSSDAVHHRTLPRGSDPALRIASPTIASRFVQVERLP